MSFSRQPAQSTHAHHSISIHRDDTVGLCVNINMSVSQQESDPHNNSPDVEEVKINGVKYIKERQFGRIAHQNVKNKESRGSSRLFSFAIGEEFVGKEQRIGEIDEGVSNTTKALDVSQYKSREREFRTPLKNNVF